MDRTSCHYLKTWPEFFRAVKDERKTFEVRKNDRDFREGDTLVLEEYDPQTGLYSHDQVTRYVTYVLKGGHFGIAEGFAVLGLTATRPAPKCMRCGKPRERADWWGCNACVSRDRQEGLCKRD